MSRPLSAREQFHRALQAQATGAWSYALGEALFATQRMRLDFVTWLGQQPADPQYARLLRLFADDPASAVALNARMYLQHVYPGAEGTAPDA